LLYFSQYSAGRERAARIAARNLSEGAVRGLRYLLGGVVSLALLSRAVAAPPPTEYQVKAVFLFNFTRFVDWPPTALADPQAPFVIGVLGRDPFGRMLDDAVRGEQVNGRPLVVERYRSRTELKRCQILFIDRSAGVDLAPVLTALEGAGTLTVSDFEPDAPRNVTIRFLEEDHRIRLRIDVDSARSAGLTISSKLLRPAQVVGSSREN